MLSRCVPHLLAVGELGHLCLLGTERGTSCASVSHDLSCLCPWRLLSQIPRVSSRKARPHNRFGWCKALPYVRTGCFACSQALSGIFAPPWIRSNSARILASNSFSAFCALSGGRSRVKCVAFVASQCLSMKNSRRRKSMEI